MKYIFAIFTLFLASCSPSEEPLRSTRENRSFKMNVVIVPENKILQTCTDLGVAYEANGCAKFDLDKEECTIYVMPQRFPHDDERLTIIGHETWHCVYGKWHD